MEREPVQIVPVNDPLKNMLSDVYENDAIFDTFSCAASADARYSARIVSSSAMKTMFDNRFGCVAWQQTAHRNLLQYVHGA